MISEDEALKPAQVRIVELGRSAGPDLQLLESKTVRLENGWAFFYNSTDPIQTGDFRQALAGNGPIHVSNSGKLTDLPTAMSWEEAAKHLT